VFWLRVFWLRPNLGRALKLRACGRADLRKAEAEGRRGWGKDGSVGSFRFQTMTNISLRDYFAAHAPMAPTWFTSKITKAKEEMVPDLARGPGYVKSNAVILDETALQREVRWRFIYADAMVGGSTLVP
jgi:hypothetical protein